MDDHLQIPPRQCRGAQIVQAQAERDQVILDGLAVLPQEPDEAEDSPNSMLETRPHSCMTSLISASAAAS